MSSVPNSLADLAASACEAISRIIATVSVDAGRVVEALGRDRAKAVKRHQSASARLKTARRSLERLAAVEAIPLIGVLIVDPVRRRFEAAEASRDRATEKLKAVDSKRRSARRLQSKCLETVGRLDTCAIEVLRMPAPPQDLKGAIRTACNRAIHVSQRRDRKLVKEILGIAGDVLDVAREWRDGAATDVRMRATVAARNGPSAPPADSGVRIFLPVPRSIEREALRLGAHVDPSVTVGSRVFLTPQDDLKPFGRMLPLAYRHGGAKLRFPPIPAKAARHNIWSMFDKDTWNRLRHATYEAAGRRCVVCGGRGGYFARRVLGQNNAGSVDCHEIWSWKVSDASTGVGLQTLKSTLAVCVDCHMCFHSGFALAQAQNAGLRDEVAARINERRLLVNQIDQPALDRMLDRDEAAWRATDGIDNWVVDLGQIAGRMPPGTDPVFLTGNEAGVRPEMIGGLSFVTDDGRAFEARPGEEIFRAETQRAEDKQERSRGRGTSRVAQRTGAP